MSTHSIDCSLSRIRISPQLKTFISNKNYSLENDYRMQQILTVIQSGRVPTETGTSNKNRLTNERKQQKIMDYLIRTSEVGSEYEYSDDEDNTLEREYKESERQSKRNKLIAKMKEEYKIVIEDGEYPLPSEGFKARSKRYKKTMLKELMRLEDYLYFKKCVLNALSNQLKPEIDDKEEEQVEKEHEEKISSLLSELEEKEAMCRTALGYMADKIQNACDIDEFSLQRITNETNQYKNNIMKMIKEGRKTLVKLMKKRKKKKLKTWMCCDDQICDTCFKLEEDWEKDRLTADLGSDPLTAEDARHFHSRLVRNGGMQSLVDHFRNMLDTKVQNEIVFPVFVCSVTHSDNSQELMKTLMCYHHLKCILEELKWINRKNSERVGWQLSGPNTRIEKPDELCFYCKKICNENIS